MTPTIHGIGITLTDFSTYLNELKGKLSINTLTENKSSLKHDTQRI